MKKEQLENIAKQILNIENTVSKRNTILEKTQMQKIDELVKDCSVKDLLEIDKILDKLENF